MTKHHGRRAARPLATGVMGPTATTTRRITIPMKIGPSIPFAGRALAIEVGEKSSFEKFRPNVKIQTTPDERRVLHAAHLALTALRRTFEGHGGPWPAAAAPEGRSDRHPQRLQ
jgi:hypothetical protein